MEKRQILSALVYNRAGVLVRIAGLISRRGYNIDSVTVSATENPKFSRMTIVVTCDEDLTEQLRRQLAKLEDVKVITHIEEENATNRELLVIKLKALPAERASLYKVAESYGAKVVDVGEATMTLEITGQGEEMDGFIEHMRRYEIMEMARTGMTVLEKGDRIITDHFEEY